MTALSESAPDREPASSGWAGPLAQDGPRVFTIPPGAPFLTALARGVYGALPAGADPAALADAQILLPTRRAARALARAFLASGPPGAPAAIAPRIRPIGDVDEDDLDWTTGLGSGDDPTLPAALEPARRRLLLAQLVSRWGERKGEAFAPGGALALADELARLLDSLYTEEIDADALQTLAPSDHAQHWEQSLEFLRIITAELPAILEADGCMDPAARRIAAIDRLATAWAGAPPAGPVIAAGSTGSAPAVARLMGVIARAPAGCVVLPGLDLEMDAAGWAAIDDPHPQMGLKRLLAALDVPREAV
ncbi:MAG: hypothetical protein AAGL49_03780, partial [Pseudomonadota bacterium]